MLESNYNDVAIPIKSMQNATKIVISNFFIVTLFPDLFSSCLISLFFVWEGMLVFVLTWLALISKTLFYDMFKMKSSMSELAVKTALYGCSGDLTFWWLAGRIWWIDWKHVCRAQEICVLCVCVCVCVHKPVICMI